MAKKPNLVLLGIDSLRADHMSCYGYHRLTTPHLDEFAMDGVLFENLISAHIPTTPGYANMLTGMDCFGTGVVALRHQGGLTEQVKTLPELLREQGYVSSCVGFTGNPSSRGFDTYLNFPGWGAWEAGPSPKAEELNKVAIPELERLAAGDEPFFLFLRHMDPHSPYLPPAPFNQMFYSQDATDPALPDTLAEMKEFKPFRDYLLSWMPPGVRDAEYVNCAYDSALAYMDACIQRIFTRLDELGLRDETIVVVNSDHGETLDEHDCYFDHHGLYEPTLTVPLIIRYPEKLPAGERVSGLCLHQDLVPTLLALMDIEPDCRFDGEDLAPRWLGEAIASRSECYITECTWMRKEGWRTPEWKLIRALEPDFHFKPAVELYNLVLDPLELNNVAEQEPGIVEALTQRMRDWVAKREAETGATNPMYTQKNWSGVKEGPFESSQEAFDTQYIGSASQAHKLQAGNKDEEKAKA